VFAKGALNVGEEWEAALAAENLSIIRQLVDEAGKAVDAAVRADLPSPLEESGFLFPDETWARVIYDVVIAYHERRLPLERLVTSLIPLYFGRVASLIFETRELTTDQAEAFVERQARTFELSKPYLVERWSSAPSTPDAESVPVADEEETAQVPR
jgi:hypothetical protein